MFMKRVAYLFRLVKRLISRAEWILVGFRCASRAWWSVWLLPFWRCETHF